MNPQELWMRTVSDTGFTKVSKEKLVTVVPTSVNMRKDLAINKAVSDGQILNTFKGSLKSINEENIGYRPSGKR